MPASVGRRVVCRLYQTVLYISSAFIPWPAPKLIKDQHSFTTLCSIAVKKKLHKGLLLATPGIIKRGQHTALTETFTSKGIEVIIFDQVTPDPTVDLIETAVTVYRENNCDHIIAFGGGSAIDCAKVVGARVVRPKKSIAKMKGLFGVMWKIPPLFAIPTTAGTGSECTMAAVVSNTETNEKYALVDPKLCPSYAVLDSCLTTSMPPFVTATTGMDTLTHAIEAYLNIFQTCSTKKNAVQSIKLTFSSLTKAFADGEDLQARAAMQEAAYLAGLALNRAYVGNVHAVAHALGGFYHVPHGYANAVTLPVILEMYGSIVHQKLAFLADEVGIVGGTTVEEKANGFIEAIKEMNASMNIPPTLGAQYAVAKEDIPKMAKQALDEANPLYPVPVIFSEKEFICIFQNVIGEYESTALAGSKNPISAVTIKRELR